jgi:cytochrome c-type biogenesis protein CcmH
VSDDEVNRIAKGLYCPVCQNVPLEVCQTEACARWREQVRDLIAQGESEQQIRDYFVQHFGAQTVGVPTNSTAQLFTIVLPFALIALVLAVIAYNLVVWRRRRAAIQGSADTDSAGSAPRAAPDEYRARLEEDVRKHE